MVCAREKKRVALLKKIRNERTTPTIKHRLTAFMKQTHLVCIEVSSKFSAQKMKQCVECGVVKGQLSANRDNFLSVFVCYVNLTFVRDGQRETHT